MHPPRAVGCRVPAVRGDAAGYGDDWRTLVLQVGSQPPSAVTERHALQPCSASWHASGR